LDHEQILAAVTDVIRDVLNDPSLAIGPETTADQTEGWDSMNHIMIVVAIEQKFGIKFKTAEIESLRNVGEFVSLIDTKLQSKR
jgi:acyl carrier protein